MWHHNPTAVNTALTGQVGFLRITMLPIQSLNQCLLLLSVARGWKDNIHYDLVLSLLQTTQDSSSATITGCICESAFVPFLEMTSIAEKLLKSLDKTHWDLELGLCSSTSSHRGVDIPCTFKSLWGFENITAQLDNRKWPSTGLPNVLQLEP